MKKICKHIKKVLGQIDGLQAPRGVVFHFHPQKEHSHVGDKTITMCTLCGLVEVTDNQWKSIKTQPNYDKIPL